MIGEIDTTSEDEPCVVRPTARRQCNQITTGRRPQNAPSSISTLHPISVEIDSKEESLLDQLEDHVNSQSTNSTKPKS